MCQCDNEPAGSKYDSAILQPEDFISHSVEKATETEVLSAAAPVLAVLPLSLAPWWSWTYEEPPGSS